jgi:hypothetical protein
VYGNSNWVFRISDTILVYEELIFYENRGVKCFNFQKMYNLIIRLFFSKHIWKIGHEYDTNLINYSINHESLTFLWKNEIIIRLKISDYLSINVFYFSYYCIKNTRVNKKPIIYQRKKGNTGWVNSNKIFIYTESTALWIYISWVSWQ